MDREPAKDDSRSVTFMDPEHEQEGLAFELRFMLRQAKPHLQGLIPLLATSSGWARPR